MSASQNHTPLFNIKVLSRQMDAYRFPNNLSNLHEIAMRWVETLRSGVLGTTKELSLHGEFLQDIFRHVLGYHSITEAGGAAWELHPEKTVSPGGGQADGALGFFAPDSSIIYAPIELKGAMTDLDREMYRGYTPVDQGWRYMIETPECRWVIVSNYKETRLYHLNQTKRAFERFMLEDLEYEASFRRFYFLLCRDNFMPAKPGGKSRVAELLDESARAQVEITDKLYRQYKGLRSRIFDHLTTAYPDRDPLFLLEKTQKILDRFLFVVFAEDRGLLPRETILDAFKHADPYNPRPKWENFRAVFQWIDQGNEAMKFPAYNGGLFQPDSDLDSLILPDNLIETLAVLSKYDFEDEVSVLILGHIFEQSISDLEEMRLQASETGADSKTVSKRKREGVFYTPAFVTRYIVEQAVGRVLAEKQAAAFAQFEPEKQKSESKRLMAQILAWNAYADALTKVRILDPACGSGAFLLAAFDFLLHEYEQVNAELAALRGGQTSIFDLNKTILNHNLYGVALNRESVEITRLSLWLRTAERGKALTDLNHNIRCGNSVIADPALDPRAFDWKAAFSEVFEEGGFDIVLGNPPYVRQELLSPFKAHLESRYSSYHGVADLYTYFYELGVRLLKTGGRLSYIVTNKWMRSGYGEALRGFFADSCVFEEVLDFGHAPIFEDADVFPCIVLLRKPEASPNLDDMGQKGAPEKPEPETPVTVCPVPREVLPGLNLAQYVGREGYPVPWKRFSKASWSLEPSAVDALMEKIRRVGVPLTEYLGVKPYRGVLTGLNEAFLIDTPTRDRLVHEDPKCADIIKPYLRGQDIKRWAPEWVGLWMIFARRGIDIDAYPVIKRHLDQYRDQLEPKPKDWDGKKWPGRTPGIYKWYEIQDSVDYWHLFEKPTLMYQEIQFHPNYCLCSDGFFSNNKVFLLPTDDLYCMAVLNSPLMWWYNWRYLPHMKDEALSPKGDLMELFPVACPSDSIRQEASEKASRLVEITRTDQSARHELLDWLRMEFGLEKPGQKLEDFTSLTADEFVAEVKKRMPKGKPLSPAGLSRLRGEYANYAPPMQARRAESLTLERRLSDLVNEAYGLTPEEIGLMWKTAPPRMPLEG